MSYGNNTVVIGDSIAHQIAVAGGGNVRNLGIKNAGLVNGRVHPASAVKKGEIAIVSVGENDLSSNPSRYAEKLRKYIGAMIQRGAYPVVVGLAEKGVYDNNARRRTMNQTLANVAQELGVPFVSTSNGVGLSRDGIHLNSSGAKEVFNSAVGLAVNHYMRNGNGLNSHRDPAQGAGNTQVERVAGSHSGLMQRNAAADDSVRRRGANRSGADSPRISRAPRAPLYTSVS